LGAASSDFDSMPELRTLLEAHLQLTVDPSVVVRSIYGRWLPQIHFLDPVWTAAHVGQIFPTAGAQVGLRRAAWNSYILYCRPYDEVLHVVRDQYLIAASELGQLDEVSRPSSAQRLAEHLMMFYMRGQIPLHDELLLRFLGRATAAIRRHAMAFIGRVLSDNDDLDEVHRDRAAALWESWSRDLDALSEAFGWWFSSRWLDAEWRLDQLERVLSHHPSVEDDDSVFEEFVDLIPQRPVAVLRCVRRMVDGAADWKLFSWRKPLRQVLETALHSKNPDVVEAARAIVGILVARGETEYILLLTSPG
jgi:hypothetical protein